MSTLSRQLLDVSQFDINMIDFSAYKWDEKAVYRAHPIGAKVMRMRKQESPHKKWPCEEGIISTANVRDLDRRP